MRKIADNVENQIIEMTKNRDSARKITKILGIVIERCLKLEKGVM